MNASSFFWGLLIALPLLLGSTAGMFSHAAGPAHAFDACDELPPETTELISIVSPPLGPYGYGGEAPLNLVIRIEEGLVIFEHDSVVSHLDWGDGAISNVQVLPCPGGEDAYWAVQEVAHQYATPGEYMVTWHINAGGEVFVLPFLGITVVAAAPTQSTPPPAQVTQAPATTPSVAAGQASPVASATETPARTTTTATATRGATTTATPTPTPSPTAAGESPSPEQGGPDGGGGSAEPPNADYRPGDFVRVPEIQDISTDGGVAATNLVIAGVTVWVLFTTVLLNQVLQSNRAEIDQKTARIVGPVRRAMPSVRAPFASSDAHPIAKRFLAPAVVLVFTGLVYSVLDPGFGLNRQTAVLFGSALLGVGVVTYACAGLEALLTRRYLGATAAVRPFPACIAIAVGSVALSRILGLHPGVMYGFVASCAVVGPVTATTARSGRMALATVGAAVGLAVAAWLVLGPVRELNESWGGWFPAMLEATAIVVLLGGIEGVALGMLPVQETDGGKLFRWNRWLWFAIALTAAFLTWHVLLGREQEFFSGLREASSVTVLVVFVAYSLATGAIWAYFRFRAEPATAVAAGPTAAG